MVICSPWERIVDWKFTQIIYDPRILQLRMEAWKIQDFNGVKYHFFMSHSTYKNYTYNFVIFRLTFVVKNTAVFNLTKKNNWRQLIYRIAKK